MLYINCVEDFLDWRPFTHRQKRKLLIMRQYVQQKQCVVVAVFKKERKEDQIKQKQIVLAKKRFLRVYCCQLYLKTSQDHQSQKKRKYSKDVSKFYNQYINMFPNY